MFKSLKKWIWYITIGYIGLTFIIWIAILILPQTPLLYWLEEQLFYILTRSVGNPHPHEVRNQKGEIKEVFNQSDIISATRFQLEILKTGYDAGGKFKEEISHFLENDAINNGKATFVAQYCYAEFKITNLVSAGYRIDGRQIEATNVADASGNNLEQITVYRSTERNNSPMDHAGEWKTGVVLFDCEKNKKSTYLISFSSCALRDGCGDENENTCLGNPSCPYKTYEEYIRDVHIAVSPFGPDL